MDENKLKKLKQVNYRILKTCRTCLHGRFAPAAEWGTCISWHYHHKKHGDMRDLSIHVCGGCPCWEVDMAKMGLLGKFAALLIEDGVPLALGAGADPRVEKKLRAEWAASGDLFYCKRCGKQVIVGTDHDCKCTRCGGAGEKPLPCPVCEKVMGEG